MSKLEDILSELMEADTEAKNMVEASSAEAEAILQTAKSSFEDSSAKKLNATQAQANSIMESVLGGIDAQVAQMTDEANEQRAKFVSDFEKTMPQVVATIVSEIADGCRRKAER